MKTEIQKEIIAIRTTTEMKENYKKQSVIDGYNTLGAWIITILNKYLNKDSVVIRKRNNEVNRIDNK